MSDFVRTQPILTQAGARAALDAALAKAGELGVKVNVAVADHSGELICFERMDGAWTISAPIARDKAWTVAAGGGLRSDQWYDIIKDEPALLTGFPHRDNLVVFGGGVPIMVDGQLAGTVGVSGGTAEEDRAIAEAGVAAVTGDN